MEPVGAFFDEEWESLSKMFSTEDSDILLHLHGNESISNLVENNMFINSEIPPNFFSSNHIEIDKLFCPMQENYVNFQDQPTGFCAMDLKDDSNFPVSFPDNHVMDHRTAIAHPSDMVDSIKETEYFKRNPETPQEKLEENISPKKKSRVSNASRNKAQIAQTNKNKNVDQSCNDEVEETNGGEKKGKSCSSNSSEDDCNGCQERNGGENSESKGSALTVSSNGKARASRGSATDPQSLYARRRRERINERLRILQNLVPNGTKVDISTMLEEAVHYVKFLQLQIKLLSSDEMWMYAPIAYNGMDMGLYEKISTPPFYA